MPDEQRLEEQMLSQGAERMISDQLDKVEKIDVDVQTDLFKVVQGQVDGVAFAGKGLVMRGIRVQEIKLQTDSISVNPLSAIFGQIELNQPVDATARVVLTEGDINRALTSNYVRSQIQNFDLNVDGEIVSFKPQQIQLYLPGGGKMKFNGTVLLHEKGNTRSLSFTAMVSPRTLSQPVMIESFNCSEGDGISLEIIVALVQKGKELVNLPYFEFDDMSFRIKNMEVQEGSMTLFVETRLRQIPSQ